VRDDLTELVLWQIRIPLMSYLDIKRRESLLHVVVVKLVVAGKAGSGGAIWMLTMMSSLK